MTTELLIAGKGAGKIWECSNSVKSVVWKTERTGAPGSLQFTIVKSGDLSFEEGDTVRFSVDGQLQFYGWVFTKSKNRWGEIDVTCYDRLRYLKANAAYNFKNQKAGDIIRQIAEDFRLEVSFVARTDGVSGRRAGPPAELRKAGIAVASYSGGWIGRGVCAAIYGNPPPP